MDEQHNPRADAAHGNSELDDVVPVYANNVRFEMTAWDLRILFGQLMPNSEGKGQVDWHTDVTLPWAQAKLMHLYLGMNLTLYERENGQITIDCHGKPMRCPGTPAYINRFPSTRIVFDQFQNLSNIV